MASLYTFCVEKGYEYLSSTTPLKAWKHFQALQSSQWLQYAELTTIRWLKLQQLLQHSFDNIPFYQRIWKERGIDPSAFCSEADMVDLPTVTKESLTTARLNGELGLENKKYQMVRTSGTTGQVFNIPYTLNDFQKKYAAYLRQVYASGWRLGSKSASVYHFGHPQNRGKFSGTPERDAFLNYRRLALRLAHRRIALPPYSESQTGNDEFPRIWHWKLVGFKPTMLETLEGHLPILVDYIDKIGLGRPRIPIIYVLGAVSEKRRSEYREFFSGDLFNRYSPHEAEGIAFACDFHKGMHISIDAFHIEFLDDHDRPVPPNTLGHVAITDLENYTMPLIRYKIGDLGLYYDDPCGCGRGLPLGEICGRAKDLFTLPDARTVAPSEIVRLLQDHRSVSLFQVIQDGDTIRANIVPRANAVQNDLCNDISRDLRKLLGESNKLAVRIVEKIPLEKNGKICLIKRTRADQ